MAYREISRLALHPRTKDLRGETYSAFVTDALLDLPENGALDVSGLKQRIEAKFGLREIPAPLLHEVLTGDSERFLETKHANWTLSDRAREEAVRARAETERVLSDMLTAFTATVQGLIGFKLDRHQTHFIHVALEHSLYEVLETLGDSTVSFYENLPQGGRIVLLRQSLERSAAVIQEPTIERAEDIRRVLPEAIERLLTAAPIEFSRGLLQIATKHVMWRIMGADPSLSKLRRELFDGTEILLDTNILISALCEGSARHEQTIWFLDAAKSVGVRFSISDLTATEYGTAVAFADQLFTQSFDGHLNARLVSNEIARTFFENQQGLTDWAGYVTKLRQGVSIFSARWDARVVHSADYPAVQSGAENASRVLDGVEGGGATGKPFSLIRHDAKSLLLIQAIRASGEPRPFNSPWFITHDAGLRRADTRLTKELGFALGGTMSVESWFELIYPFIWTEVEPEKAAESFTRILASSLLPIPPPSAASFVSYLALQLEIPRDEEVILRNIVEGSQLRRALERSVESGNTPRAMDLLQQMISERVSLEKDYGHQKEVSAQLGEKVKKLKARDPAAFITFDEAAWAAGILAIESAVTNDQKKRTLEDFAAEMVSAISGLSVIDRNVRTHAEEIDLLVSNNWHGAWGDPMLFECKNWSKPVGKPEVVNFVDNLRHQDCKWGILLARRGITGTEVSDAALVVREALYKDKIRIVVLTLDDLKAVHSAEQLWGLLSIRYYSPLAKKVREGDEAAGTSDVAEPVAPTDK